MNETSRQVAPVRLDLGTRLVIVLGGLMAALALTAINSVLPQIDDVLAHSDRDSMLVKQLIGGVGLAMVLGAALSGFLVDRFGLRRVMIIASIIYVIAGTAGLYLDSLQLLLASRLLMGVAAACIQVSSLALINRRLEGQQRARWMGIHVSGAMIGTILIHPVAGNLGELSWRYPFALYALGLVLVFAMVFSRVDEHDVRTAAPARVTSAVNLSLGGWLRGLRWFPFHYLPFAFLVGSLMFLPNVYLPFILREFGATPSLVAYVLTAESVTGSIVAMLYGPARRILSHHAAFLVSFACAAAGTLMALAADSLTGVIVGMLVFGLGGGWLVPNLMTALGGKVSHDRQGRAAGWVKSAHFLSAPLAIVLIEPFARYYGQQSSLLVVACTAMVLLVLISLRMAQQRLHPLNMAQA